MTTDWTQGAIRITGVDPGFKFIGVSNSLFIPSRGLQLQKLRLIETKKDTKKKNIRAKSDDLRRLLEIVRQFDEIVRHWPADVYAFEECPSIAQNARTTRQCALGWSACCSLAARRSGVLILEYGPKHLKTVVTGKGTASKKEMIEVLESRFEAFASFELAKSKREHLADAIAAAQAAAQDPAVLALANAVRKAATA